MDNVAMNVRQSEISSLIFKRQPSMVDSHQVEDCSVQIVYVNGVLDDVVTILVRRFASHPFLDS